MRKKSPLKKGEEKVLKAAVVGVGNMGKNHVRVYSELQEVELVAICDANLDLAKQLAKKYGAKAYASVDQMLEAHVLDVVSTAVPVKYNKEVAISLFEHGVNVLVEKPIASTIHDAEAMIRAAKDAGVVFTVGHIERFNPAVTAVKRLIDSGGLGELVSIHARRLGLKPVQFKDVNVVLDIGIHDIDIINYLLGANPHTVWASGRPVLIKELEDHADVFMLYDRAVGHVTTNWVTPRKVRTLTVTGSRGYVEIDYTEKTATLYEHGYPQEYETYEELMELSTKPPPASLLVVEDVEPLTAELSEFINAVLDHREPLVRPEEALSALRIALTASKQMRGNIL